MGHFDRMDKEWEAIMPRLPDKAEVSPGGTPVASSKRRIKVQRLIPAFRARSSHQGAIEMFFYLGA
jgi:hypothetical protein